MNRWLYLSVAQAVVATGVIPGRARPILENGML